MSYILDALRKADAERERGAVPGLNAQAMPPHPDDAAPARPTSRLPWAIAAASLLLLGALAWFTLGREAPPAALPPVATALPGRSTLPARVPDAPRAPPPPMAALAPPPEALPAAAPPPRVAVPAPRKPAPEAQAEAGSTKPDPKTRAAAGSSANAASAAPTAAAVVPLRELPDEVRRQIPALAVGGSMYSKDAASRMLIVNGQVLHEGDDVAPGLKLEQIRLKAAVLRFQQHRFEITY